MEIQNRKSEIQNPPVGRESPRDFPLPSEPGYKCIKAIANGGYGYVYLFATKQRKLTDRHHVAGKFVYQNIFGPADDPSSTAAYQRALEGLQNFRSLSAESPYLLRVYDVRHRHEAGYFCYMMELADDMVSGQAIDSATYKPRTLKNELERSGPRTRLPARECTAIAIALARGLQVLHESGFTHRDLRPSNIIFVNNVPKLADIDLLAGHDPTLTSYIPRDYAAPEGSHSRQADIYSFGKTLYEMATGLSVKDYPCLPLDIRHWTDHRLVLQLNKVIARACARDLRKRYNSARHLLNDLEHIQG
jgi:serine/threonine protein kinase